MIDTSKHAEDYSAKALVELMKCDRYCSSEKRSAALQDEASRLAVHVQALAEKSSVAKTCMAEYRVLMTQPSASSTTQRLSELFDQAHGRQRDSDLITGTLEPLNARFTTLRETLRELNNADKAQTPKELQTELAGLAACKAELAQLEAEINALDARLSDLNPYSTERACIGDYIQFRRQAETSCKAASKELHAMQRLVRMLDAGRQEAMPEELYRAASSLHFWKAHKSYELVDIESFTPSLRNSLRRVTHEPQPEPKHPIDVLEEDYNQALSTYQRMQQVGEEQLPDWKALLSMDACQATRHEIQAEHDRAFTRSIVGANLSKLLIFTAPDFFEATESIRRVGSQDSASTEQALGKFELARTLFVRQRNADCRDFRDKAGHSETIEECDRYYQVFLTQRDLGIECERLLTSSLKQLTVLANA